MENKCTFLLSSYDGGEDCWEGFFMSLKDRWPEMDMPIVLNTETKSYSFPGFDITTYGLHGGKKTPWGKRLLDTLNRISTPYVLFFLEDYWLDEKVDDAFFRKVLKWLDENDDIATFSFYPCLPGGNIDDCKFERFELRPDSCEYKFNCQVALWRREKLIEYIRPHESAWDWEIWGSIRGSQYSERFYTLKEEAPRVFSYGDNLKGCIVHKGKWNKDEVMPFVERYNLSIDFSKRGFEDWEKIEKIENATVFQRLFMEGSLERIKYRLSKPFKKWKSLK